MNEAATPTFPVRSAPPPTDDLQLQSGPVGRARVDEQAFDAQQLHECAVAIVRGGFTPRTAVTIPKEAYFEE